MNEMIDKSMDLLKRLGVNFESKNNGYRLIIKNDDNFCDFLPSSGIYKIRIKGSKFKKGFKKMLIDMKILEQNQEILECTNGGGESWYEMASLGDFSYANGSYCKVVIENRQF